MDAPLKGIRIIDWTIWQQGPVATTMLADMGAEVIKIEEREKGDPGRSIFSMGGASAQRSGANYYFEANNRHKQSIALDLGKPAAREIVYKLAAQSDVFVQNFRKGVADRLGLGYAELSARNPKIIYANSTGYGPHGPDSGEPSFDYLAQARSGIMNIASVNTEEPIYLNGGLADQMRRDHAGLRDHDRAGRARALRDWAGGQRVTPRLDDRAAGTERLDAHDYGQGVPAQYAR